MGNTDFQPLPGGMLEAGLRRRGKSLGMMFLRGAGEKPALEGLWEQTIKRTNTLRAKEELGGSGPALSLGEVWDLYRRGETGRTRLCWTEPHAAVHERESARTLQRGLEKTQLSPMASCPGKKKTDEGWTQYQQGM